MCSKIRKNASLAKKYTEVWVFMRPHCIKSWTECQYGKNSVANIANLDPYIFMYLDKNFCHPNIFIAI